MKLVNHLMFANMDGKMGKAETICPTLPSQEHNKNPLKDAAHGTLHTG
jgi:hypothetical protein